MRDRKRERERKGKKKIETIQAFYHMFIKMKRNKRTYEWWPYFKGSNCVVMMTRTTMILTHFGCNAAKPILTHTQQKRRKKNSFCLWNNDVGVPFGSSIYGWDSRNGFTSCENITDYVLNRTDDRYRLKCLTENIYIYVISIPFENRARWISTGTTRATHTHTHAYGSHHFFWMLFNYRH